MATSHPMRLDQKLLEAATRAGEIYKRSPPRQIEYWAELGRAVADQVDPVDLLKLQQGLVRLTLQPVASSPVDAETVLEDLRAARASKRLSGQVTGARVRYQASTRYPGLLDQLLADGRRRVGRFVSGHFVEKR